MDTQVEFSSDLGIVGNERSLKITYGGAVLEYHKNFPEVVCFLEPRMVKAIQENWETHEPAIMDGKLVLKPREER